MPALYTHQLNT